MLREVVPYRHAYAACDEHALSRLDGVVDEALFCVRQREQVRPALPIERGLLVQQAEVGIQDHVASRLMREHVGRVLGDSRGYQIELAAFRPELGEVVDDGGVPEKGLHLVDVEPGGDSQLEVVYMRFRTASRA